uniref:Histone deacetylase domain-containing protein n=1 Tax=Pygocentrus nattereri TaxID=42514 RepID=A0AAR2JIE3_PYGNA
MSGTAFVYDEEMTRYKLLWTDPACEIEVPERLTVSYEAVKSAGLEQRCEALSVPKIKSPELHLFIHLAIGATLQLVDSVMTGKVRNGMALVRPPGHHSQRSEASGFCVFNNVAIAAHYAKKHYNLNRVLIVDWDIHHGQGVQYSFEEDPSVLYFSWHRYEHQRFWPNLAESDYDSVGKGKGAGFNINVPWNKIGMTNSDYLSVFFHVLLPVAYEFDPELVLVCAGFDSGIGDPEGRMCATPEIFGHLTHLLMSLANGRLCFVLEGGYNLTSLAQSVCQTLQTLLGDPTSLLTGIGSPCHSALDSVHNVRAVHQNFTVLLLFAAQSLNIDGRTALLCLSLRMLQGVHCRASVMQAVLGLLLPLAYEFNPGLVLEVLADSAVLEVSVWVQISSLLQGLAQGRTLTLLQVSYCHVGRVGLCYWKIHLCWPDLC